MTPVLTEYMFVIGAASELKVRFRANKTDLTTLNSFYTDRSKHYENTPIQIYWKFYNKKKKKKIFR